MKTTGTYRNPRYRQSVQMNDVVRRGAVAYGNPRVVEM